MKKVLFVFLLVILWSAWLYFRPITLDGTIVIKQGDTFSLFTHTLSVREKIRLKVYLFSAWDVDLKTIQVGTYVFSGNYSPRTFIEHVLAGPTQAYTRYTILEGRSSYDIDADLVKKWFIQPGEYLSYINDRGVISEYAQGYEFIRDIPSGEHASLEGFLYPDTYHLDLAQPVIPQLVKLQLQAFSSKVWWPYKSIDIQDRRTEPELNWIEIITLASVVEKEEKSMANKPTVAWIFIKRLLLWMQLDADITLCYGLKQPYETCTPAVISQHIADKDNVYNTRKHGGLPPQPISNPSAETIQAVLNYKKTNYLYYLHDMQGQIHYGETLDEHNANKREYL